MSGQIAKRNISNVSYNKFKKRFESINPKLHKYFLFSYANPILTKHQAWTIKSDFLYGSEEFFNGSCLAQGKLILCYVFYRAYTEAM